MSKWKGHDRGIQLNDTTVLFSISYKKEIFELTQQIYKTGLAKHEGRLKEIEAFQQRVNVTKSKTQQEGIE